MSMQPAAMVFVRALTPVHIGVDQGLGAINLPTMREVVTGHPLIPGSSFKGVLRDLTELDPETEERVEGEPAKKWAAFGPSRLNASDYRGGLVFTDARLLLLPVASLSGTFVWVTSRTVLRRYNHDVVDAGLSGLELTVPPGDDTLVSDAARLLVDGQLSIREFLLQAKHQEQAGTLAKELSKHLWSDPADREFFESRVVVLQDTYFDAMARNALEVRARVAIDGESGTAEASGPWMEEHIPVETVLAGLVFGRPTRHQLPVRKDGGAHDQDRKPQTFQASDMLGVFTGLVGGGRSLRLGGHSSIGLGRAYLRIGKVS